MDNCIIVFLIILTQSLQSLSNSLVNNLLGKMWVMPSHAQSLRIISEYSQRKLNFPLCLMKSHVTSLCVAPHLLMLDIRRKRVVSLKCWSFMSGEKVLEPVEQVDKCIPGLVWTLWGRKNSPVALGCNLFGAMKKKISHRNHEILITVKSNCLVNCLASQK